MTEPDRRRRWWPFGLLAVALVAGLVGIGLAAGRPHQAEAAYVAAPVPARPAPVAGNTPPVADNPPARADKPSTSPAQASTPPATGSTFAFDGTVELKPGQVRQIDETGCAGGPGYADIDLGTPITITDARGAVVAVGRLQLANFTPNNSMDDALGNGVVDPTTEAGTCDLQFTVTGIPINRGYYGVEVAHRGAAKFSEASLRSGPLNLFVR